MRLLSVLLVLSFNLFGLNAQPINDVCSGAVEISSGYYPLDFSSATYSGICDIDCMLTGNDGNLCAHDLWFKFALMDSMEVRISNNTSQGSLYFELYSGSCSNLSFELCANTLGFGIKLPSGNYFLKTSMNFQGGNYMDVDICADISIDPIDDVYACESYTLPPITGINLTGNQAYYTGGGGTGTKYLPGDVITTSLTLHAFDNSGTFCSSTQSFSININYNGSTRTPLGSGSWNSSPLWGFSRPGACDDVIIENFYDIYIPDNGVIAKCKTLEIELGGEFEVYSGGMLQVGIK